MRGIARPWVAIKSVGIGRSADDLRAVEAKALNGGQKSRAFNDDFAARLGQCFAHQVQRLLAAGGDDELIGADGRAPALHERGQLLAQRGQPFGRPVFFAPLQKGAQPFSGRS